MLTADLWEVTENDCECYDLGISYKFIYIEIGFNKLIKSANIYVYTIPNLNSAIKMNKNYSNDSRSKINFKFRRIYEWFLLNSIIQALRYLENYEIHENSD